MGQGEGQACGSFSLMAASCWFKCMWKSSHIITGYNAARGESEGRRCAGERKTERAERRRRDSKRKEEAVRKAMVPKPEGQSAPNFVACLCHQHPVGMTDVQMMSCRKEIGREGGATGAREASGQA